MRNKRLLLSHTTDCLKPRVKSWEDNFLVKLEHSKSHLYLGNWESHTHAQCKTLAQKTSEKTTNFHFGLIPRLSANLPKCWRRVLTQSQSAEIREDSHSLSFTHSQHSRKSLSKHYLNASQGIGFSSHTHQGIHSLHKELGILMKQMDHNGLQQLKKSQALGRGKSDFPSYIIIVKYPVFRTKQRAQK